MSRYFIELSYLGTHFHGWQSQKGSVRTVQGELLRAIQVIHPKVEKLTGCGRTDTGVHAQQYFAHFDIDEKPHDELLYKLNRLLPPDVAIQRIFPVSDKAHARFSATEREYAYHLHFKKDPFQNGVSAFHRRELDLTSMNNAAALLAGEKDFSAFCKSGSDVGTFICDVRKATWEQAAGGLVFVISADRFLRNMVRAIVGTLLQTGEGKLSFQEFKSIIESKDRSKAGKSAAACGLHLTRVEYPSFDTL